MKLKFKTENVILDLKKNTSIFRMFKYFIDR